MALNARQKLFIKAYAATKNATKAALAAGYSKKTAMKTGSENLHKPEIKAALQELLDKQHAKFDVTAERIIEELAMMGFMSLSKLRSSPLKGSDKIKSLELLAKTKKMLTDKFEHSGDGMAPQIIVTMPSNGREAPKDDPTE